MLSQREGGLGGEKKKGLEQWDGTRRRLAAVKLRRNFPTPIVSFIYTRLRCVIFYNITLLIKDIHNLKNKLVITIF